MEFRKTEFVFASIKPSETGTSSEPPLDFRFLIGNMVELYLVTPLCPVYF